MSVLLGALLPYAGATIAVFLFWRFLRTKRPYLLLAVIYLAAFVLWHLFNALLLGWQAGWPHGIEAWVATTILYVSGVHFFLGNYTCIEGETPSMILFTLIEEAGDEGCRREAIVRGFRELGHVEDRLDTMQSGGLLRAEADGTLSATRTGNVIRWGFDACFGLLGHEETTDD